MTSQWIWLYLFIFFVICILLPMRRRRKSVAALMHIKRKNALPDTAQKEAEARRFIGKKVNITTLFSDIDMINGRVTEISGGWIMLEDEISGLQAVNLVSVSRISECPEKKNKQKKH